MTIYDIFFFLFSIVYLPYLIVKGKAHKDFTERLGRLPDISGNTGASRPIWVHAVSVGEVLAAKNFVEKICAKFPGRKVVLSTTTKTGNDIARRVLDENILKFYFPLDFSFVVKRVVNLINPSVLVIMETEIWPNLIHELSRRSVPVILINGRLSDRSFRGYRKIRFFFSEILKKVNLFCMQSAEDALRIKALGAPEANVKTTGNMKFDIGNLPDRVSQGTLTYAVGKVLIDESCELLIAGSTHGGEEEIVLDVYSRLREEFRNLRLLIAPRHIDRAGTIKKMVEERGFKAVLLSQVKANSTPGVEWIPPREWKTQKAVLILDTFGDLTRLYRLATIVFMGGSLLKRGGHNILEPAAFATPIVFGPYMFNFRNIARHFLENKAAIKVKNKKELLETLKMLLKDKNRKTVLGRNAKELINGSRGATERNINELERLICTSSDL